jgi:hypothetical protein
VDRPGRVGIEAAGSAFEQLRRGRLAQRGEDERTGETSRGNERSDTPDEGVGEGASVAAPDAGPPRSSSADNGDRDEDESEDHGAGRKERDL